MVDHHTVEAILEYQEEIKAKDEDCVFPKGNGPNPANMWVQKLKRFFVKHKLDVKSHDFRVIQTTEFFDQCNDIVQV